MLDCGRASDGRWLRYHDAMVEINERKKGDGGDPESADRPHGDNIVGGRLCAGFFLSHE